MSPFGPCGPCGSGRALAHPADLAGPVVTCGPAGTCGALGPAGPAGPCGPVAPCGPCGPTGPIGPTGPGTPCGPCGPDAGGRARRHIEDVAIVAGISLEHREQERPVQRARRERRHQFLIGGAEHGHLGGFAEHRGPAAAEVAPLERDRIAGAIDRSARDHELLRAALRMCADAVSSSAVATANVRILIPITPSESVTGPLSKWRASPAISGRACVICILSNHLRNWCFGLARSGNPFIGAAFWNTGDRPATTDLCFVGARACRAARYGGQAGLAGVGLATLETRGGRSEATVANPRRELPLPATTASS